MDSNEIRERFFKFFENIGYKQAPSSSLIPDDPSVLLTTAGMQQFKRYYTGELDAQKDFGSQKVVSIQKCFRTSDIDEVGDESHLTFFEMMGHFSFNAGANLKRDAITSAYEFLTKELGLEVDYITVFDPLKVEESDWRKTVPFDEQSYDIWKNEIGISEENIHREGTDNFWGPTGNEGPCGPTTEIYIKTIGGKSIEVWNLVFNAYYRTKEGVLKPAEMPGLDTGMGLERLAMVVQKVPTIFDTDLFLSIIKSLPEGIPMRTKRIIADHLRGIAFLISEGVRPSNKEAGYILRRLIRRVVTHAGNINLNTLLGDIIAMYKKHYPTLKEDIVLEVFNEESERFSKTLQSGIRELNNTEKIDTLFAFKLYESFGLPYEVLMDLGGDKTKNLVREDFDKELEKHREISRAGAEKKFGGHGLIMDTGELKAGNEEELKQVTRLHTATHLLQQALRDVLGNEVQQRGSDITPERTRFDFSFPRKLTVEEIKKVEEIVNQKIKEDLPVQYKELSKETAEKTGALFFFKQKYPETVKVYYAGDNLESAYSKEFCGGPHVTHTGEIGVFKIAKEEAVGAGIRRIRATVQ